MTSKNLFFNLFKEEIKRRLWSMALSFLIFFFAYPVAIALYLGNQFKQEIKMIYITNTLNDVLGFHNGWAVVLFAFLSVLMGVSGFSYLHSRQKVDFYHGIPVNRKHLFMVNYLSGILIVAVAYGVNLLISLGVIAANGISPGIVFSEMGVGYLLFVLHYAMIYSVTILAMILTGNSLVGILGTMVFQFYFLIVCFVLELCFRQFFYTVYDGEVELFFHLIDKSSPIALFVTNVEQLSEEVTCTDFMLRIGAVICVTLVLAFVSFWFYKKRGLESAGKAMAFKVSMPIVRIPIVILAALCGGLFFWFMHSSLGWAIFGLICGLLLSHCIIEIIYHFDFRKMFCNWPQMLISGVIAAIIFSGFRYDLFGYDKYIPNENSIESVAFAPEYNNNWISYGNVAQNNKGEYYWEYIDTNAYLLSHMELTEPEPILSLVKEAVERNQKLNHEVRNSDYEEDELFRFSVKYNLKNGKSIYRSYVLSGNSDREEMEKIYEMPDFISAMYPILQQTPEDTAWVRINDGQQINIVSRDRNGSDKAMTEKLLLAYQEDLSHLTVEDMRKENPVATIQFLTKIQAELEERQDETQSSWKYSDVTSRGYYPVYPSFKNTLQLLKECQVDVENWGNKEDVIEIQIDLYQINPYQSSYDGYIYTVSDPEEIRQIMNQAVNEEYSSMNPFSFYDGENISFTAADSIGGSRKEVSYTIPFEKLPESLKEKLDEIKKQV